MRSLLLILLAACATSADASATPSCAQRAAELGAWATAIAPEGDATVMMRGVSLVDAPDAPLYAGQPRVTTIVITPSGTTADGEPAEDPAALREHVLRAHIDPRVGGRERAELWIDRDAPVARIAAVTDALARAGVREIVFVVRRAAKSPTPPPPRSAISDRLATIMRDEPPTSAVELADLMKQLFAACPSYPAAMHAAGDEKLGKAVAMAHGLERVTARCDCKVDLDSLRSVVWDLIGPADRPLMGAVTTTVATTGDKGVTVIRGATWADAAPAVIAAHDAHIRFVAR